MRSTIELARALNLTLVAEGIETEEVFTSLQDLGADIGQGYLIARPLTTEQLNDYLAQPPRARQPLPDPPLLLTACSSSSTVLYARAEALIRWYGSWGPADL